jgi:hypothetical protein
MKNDILLFGSLSNNNNTANNKSVGYSSSFIHLVFILMEFLAP